MLNVPPNGQREWVSRLHAWDVQTANRSHCDPWLVKTPSRCTLAYHIHNSTYKNDENRSLNA